MTVIDRGLVAGRWAPANKLAIGTAIAEVSRVWFTTAPGRITEAFYPVPDQACLRSVEVLVGDRDAVSAPDSTEAMIVPGDAEVPIGHQRVRCIRSRYELEQEVIADPRSDVILMRVRFQALRAGAFRLFCVVEPALGNSVDGNTALVEVHKGARRLCAVRDALALAVGCSTSIASATAGSIGEDGRCELTAHGALVSSIEHAGPGAVSICGELVLPDDGELVLAIGFGRTTTEANHLVSGALHRGYDEALAGYTRGWKAWHATLVPPLVDGTTPALLRRSATILKVLEAKHPHSGRVAALSTPWGDERGPGIEGTYHLVWTRDLVESVGALVAAGARHEAMHALHYVSITQESDGHWPQNMRLDGRPVWNNDELDEAALPIVFLDLIERDGVLTRSEVARHWPMIRRAAGYIARSGPATTRDRWEDTSGVTPFTISAAIVALLVAAELAERFSETLAGAVLRGLADQWNASIERWLYRRGGPLAARHGVDGYYVRARTLGAPFPELDLDALPRTELSPDALALVRFGLRAADDPRITATVTVIDAVLRTELPGGPAWRRYPGDAYGEHPDGRGFDGGGIGRPWPLLTGERAHHELARGNRAGAIALLHAMEAFASPSGALPEQVWDAPDQPARRLIRGKPTGSAAPLGWAHGEYVKLARSLADGHVFDLPTHAVARYLPRHATPRITTWRIGDPIEPVHGALRVAFRTPTTIAWCDSAGTAGEVQTVDTGLGLHVADLIALRGREVRVTAADQTWTFINKEPAT